MKLLTIIIMTLLLTTAVIAETTYTSSTEKNCNKGVCTLTMYGGTNFVQEDGKWKSLERARSLKDKEGISLKIDYGKDTLDPKSLVVEEFNYTSITLKGIDTSELSKSSTPLPIKIYDSSGTLVKSQEVLTASKSTIDTTIKWTLGDTLHLGENSTTITLNTTSNSILEDVYINSADPSGTGIDGSEIYMKLLKSDTENNSALIKFNISILPAGAIIESSTFSLYLDYNGLDSESEGFNGTLHYINPTYGDWKEESTTWNNRPNSTQYNASRDSWVFFNKPTGGLTGRMYWDAKSIINQAKGTDTVSFYLIGQDQLGSPSGTDDVQFSTKEETTVSQRPTLNITYTEGADATPPTVNIVYPSNNTYYKYNITGVNYTATDNVNVSACWWTQNGGATNTTLTNCTNVTDINFTKGIHNITIYSNDTSNNIGSKSVTFWVDIDAPTGVLNTPINGSNTTATSNNFTVNITDDFSKKNATISIYNQFGSLVNKTTTLISGTAQATIGIVVSLVDGIYNWFYDIFDSAGNQYTTGNNTLTIDSTGPTISLTSPADGSQVTNPAQTFTADISDSGGLVDATLYVWNSTNDLVFTDTDTLTGTSDTASIGYTLSAYGIYKWNYLAVDNYNNQRFATSNKTVEYVETLNPIGNRTGCIKVINESSSLTMWEICRDGYLYTWSPSRTKYRCGMTDGGSWVCSANE